MSTISPLAYAYAYTGGNAYAYTGGNAYAYSAPLEAYGFGGFPGNPMLYASLQATRSAIRRDLLGGGLGDVGDLAPSRPWYGGGLPATDDATTIGRHGAQVRASMAMLELMSSVAFVFERNSERAVLYGACVDVADGPPLMASLVTMTRPDQAFFKRQLSCVDDWYTTRDSRVAEVLTQVAPPLACFASVMNLQSGRHAKTLEFINVALQFGYAVCMRFKHALACPRPGDYTAGLMPVIEAPPHPALPAGHANEAHITATVLTALAGLDVDSDAARALRRLAHRIGENRVVAGLHFPIDNIAGRLMGDCLADFLLAATGHPGRETWTGGDFDGTGLSQGPQPPDPRDLQLRDADSGIDARAAGLGCSAISTEQAAPPLPVLAQMWADARKEWQ